MSKKETIYSCTNCDYQTIKWLGCCPDCKEWNSLELKNLKSNNSKIGFTTTTQLTYLKDIKTKSSERMQTGIKEWDRVTGGGIVRGEFIILTGDPGIGKSTLLLQVGYELSKLYKIYYFSSEESLEQVKIRAQRLNCSNNSLLFSDQANLDNIITICEQTKPDLIIIDSIQNCFIKDSQTIPGSIAQLKESAFKLMRMAKENDIAIIISGHITKEGVIAGPKTLEHMVDAVFYLQAEDQWQTRILRSVKNRFGTINELGFFQMNVNGLEEIPNVNQQLLQDISDNPGSILTSFAEGTKPLIIEVQALVLSSKFGMPQRVFSGIDHTQIVLIAAILEKYLKIKFSAQDIFIKTTSNLKIRSNTTDLSIALSLLSSYFQKQLPEKSLALGQISLSGIIKPINYISLHTAEAEKFGIKHLLISKNQQTNSSCKIIGFNNVYELLSLFE